MRRWTLWRNFENAVVLSCRLIININDLRTFDRQLSEQLIAYPTQLLPAFEEALKFFVASLRDDSAAATNDEFEYYIGMCFGCVVLA